MISGFTNEDGNVTGTAKGMICFLIAALVSIGIQIGSAITAPSAEQIAAEKAEDRAAIAQDVLAALPKVPSAKDIATEIAAPSAKDIATEIAAPSAKDIATAINAPSAEDIVAKMPAGPTPEQIASIQTTLDLLTKPGDAVAAKVAAEEAAKAKSRAWEAVLALQAQLEKFTVVETLTADYAAAAETASNVETQFKAGEAEFTALTDAVTKRNEIKAELETAQAAIENLEREQLEADLVSAKMADFLAAARVRGATEDFRRASKSPIELIQADSRESARKLTEFLAGFAIGAGGDKKLEEQFVKNLLDSLTATATKWELKYEPQALNESDLQMVFRLWKLVTENYDGIAPVEPVVLPEPEAPTREIFISDPVSVN